MARAPATDAFDKACKEMSQKPVTGQHTEVRRSSPEQAKAAQSSAVPSRNDPASAGDEPADSRPPFEPLYLQIAKHLISQIEAGVYEVGSLLPAETELAQHLAVSRQTIRQALAELRELGLISARRGVGTRVERKEAGRRFNFSSRSVDDLINFASKTELELGFRQRFVTGPAISNMLEIPEGEQWLHYGCLRKDTCSGQTFCWTDIYIDARYADLIGNGPVLNSPVFSQIEKREGEALSEIHQDIRAVILGSAIAERLSARQGEPALEVSRRYFLPKRRLVEVSVNTIPAEHYFFSLELDLTR